MYSPNPSCESRENLQKDLIQPMKANPLIVITKTVRSIGLKLSELLAMGD
ncbi:hypothetical protein BN874_1340002 [Candidatus Contendobacter odensis Run_B_J11]|uniref:Uncharacterized protein n=1 Tax=Candidatus Contendobacter odensis Run_B_J11 TaxID=1400861 RepID=A0A7U7G8C8_9GAMM|nr:hypothetical protein BN874_1340002 [Candidatus Contendobacter odensis Run_B_J11]